MHIISFFSSPRQKQVVITSVCVIGPICHGQDYVSLTQAWPTTAQCSLSSVDFSFVGFRPLRTYVSASGTQQWLGRGASPGSPGLSHFHWSQLFAGHTDHTGTVWEQVKWVTRLRWDPPIMGTGLGVSCISVLVLCESFLPGAFFYPPIEQENHQHRTVEDNPWSLAEWDLVFLKGCDLRAGGCGKCWRSQLCCWGGPQVLPHRQNVLLSRCMAVYITISPPASTLPLPPSSYPWPASASSLLPSLKRMCLNEI